MKMITHEIRAWGSALVLVAALTSTMFAGPGPQFWAQQQRDRADAKKAQVAKAEPAKPADTPAMGCASCKTSDVTEYRGSVAGGKVPARYDTVGMKHECAMCGGSIVTARGNITNDMKDHCPICAQAKTAAAKCCTATI